MQPDVKKTVLFSIFLLGLLLAVMNPPSIPEPVPRISPERERHILYGDRNGGGHLHGMGKPCKSEFPADWSAKDIISKVRTLAANDNIVWRRGENGYYTTERTVEKVRIRVVLDGEKDDIITAYPTNVPRNPCPAPESR